jgi:protein arginine kinase activator
MLCDNCKENQANVKYTQIINGKKQEMNLCEECSQKLGITNMNFEMPITFSSFFGDFFKEFENSSFMPMLKSKEELKCKNCGLTFEEFMNNGKFGCANCYDAFQSEIDPILKKIQGSNRHIGRLGEVKKAEKLNITNTPDEQEKEQKSETQELKEELKKAVQEENYEEAARIRDKIKEIENKK